MSVVFSKATLSRCVTGRRSNASYMLNHHVRPFQGGSSAVIVNASYYLTIGVMRSLRDVQFGKPEQSVDVIHVSV